MAQRNRGTTARHSTKLTRQRERDFSQRLAGLRPEEFSRVRQQVPLVFREDPGSNRGRSRSIALSTPAVDVLDHLHQCCLLLRQHHHVLPQLLQILPTLLLGLPRRGPGPQLSMSRPGRGESPLGIQLVGLSAWPIDISQLLQLSLQLDNRLIASLDALVRFIGDLIQLPLQLNHLLFGLPLVPSLQLCTQIGRLSHTVGIVLTGTPPLSTTNVLAVHLVHVGAHQLQMLRVRQQHRSVVRRPLALEFVSTPLVRLGRGLQQTQTDAHRLGVLRNRVQRVQKSFGHPTRSRQVIIIRGLKQQPGLVDTWPASIDDLANGNGELPHWPVVAARRAPVVQKDAHREDAVQAHCYVSRPFRCDGHLRSACNVSRRHAIIGLIGRVLDVVHAVEGEYNLP
mmetsp:Transcript_158870/g.509410  ORF Transcript_158870/g.509410 Transcript_158870/m.509410 type:complete len:396 (+) Transcript_158870:980-2167(+)